jgi:GT2 family glycosyltransferase
MIEIMKVSVIIANKDGERFLKRCLESILMEKGDYEVVVIDDGSCVSHLNLSCYTSEKITFGDISDEKHLRWIKLPRNVGAAEARNIGARNSCGEYILFLDVDTKIQPGWYKEVLAFFKRNKKTGAGQVKILKMSSRTYDSAGEFMGPFGFLIERARGVKDEGQFDKESKIFSGKSAGMIIRRELFEKLDGFDRDYWIFLEDTDLFWRVWLLGWEVKFCPKVVVEHAYLTKEKPFKFYIENKVFYRGARNTIMNLMKNLEARKVWWVVPINILCWLVLGVVFCLKLDFKRGWALFSGVGWNIIYLPKVLRKRREVQKMRKIGDEELFKIVGGRQGWGYYFGKAKAYVTGRPF